MNIRRLACLLAFAALLAPPTHAAPGDVDGLDANIVALNVQVAAVQPDGKVILGGDISSVGGMTRTGIARIDANGAVDAGFDPRVAGEVRTVTVLPDGRVLIGGNFNSLQPHGMGAPVTRNRLARVDANGDLDMSFDPNFNNHVNAVVLLEDGRMLVGGQFTTVQPNGAPSPITRNRLALLNADGTVDMDYDPNADGSVVTMSLQPDGKLVIGGQFAALQPNGAASPSPRNRLARLNMDGTLDTGFTPAAVNGAAICVVVQPDGKVLVGGQFTTVQGSGEPSFTFRNRIARLNGDGTLDTAFDPNANGNLRSVTLQTDGKVLMTGAFTTLQPNGAPSPTTRNRVARVHADGTLDVDFDPNVDNAVSIASVQADGKVLIAGQFTALQPNGAMSPTPRNRLARVENDFTTQTVTAPGATQAVWTRRGAGPELASAAFDLSTDGGANWTPLGEASRVGATPDWQLTGLTLPAGGQLRARGYTTGHHGATYGLIVQVAAYGAGTLDPLDVNLGGSIAYVTVQQPDGKVIIGGDFTSVLGVPRNGIARLNADGTLDMGFDPNANGEVYAVAVQGDGKVVIGGLFSSLQPNDAGSPTTRNFIARVNEDGTLDAGFDPSPESFVNCLAVQADGKVLLSGDFGTLQPNGAPSPTPRRGIARVNEDGTLDTGFDPHPNSAVFAMAVQTDGKIVLGGAFTLLQPNGAPSPTARSRIARVNANGTLDPSFDPNVVGSAVSAVAVQADGKIVLGGNFAALQPNGAPSPTTRNGAARVDADGTLDTGFDPNANGEVRSVVVQTDGKVLLCGLFTSLQPNGAGSPIGRNYIARVNADGSLDVDFEPNPDNSVYSMEVQPDGKVLLGGQFTTLQLNGAGMPEPRNAFARLNNDAATQMLFAVDATQVAWQRSGAGPELARVSFDVRTDGGANWTLLGEGSRIGSTPDWQIDGIGLPVSGLVRARGTTVAGNSSGSSGLIEQVAAFEVSGTIGGTGGTVTGGDLPAGTTVASFTSADIGVSGGRVLRPDGRKVDAVFNENGQVLLHGGQTVPVDPAGGGAMGMIATLKAPTGDAVLAKLDRRSGATPGDDEVIFVGLLSGTPTVIARKGQLLVGLDDVRIKSFLTLDGNGTTTFFSGKLTGKGVTGGNSTAIFAAKRPGGSMSLPEAGAGAGNVKVLVRKGDIVDGRMVRTVATLVGQAKTLAEGRWRGGPDSLGVRLTFTDRTQALYLMPADAASPADWLLLGRTFDDAQPDLPGAMLQSFMLPAYAPDATVFDSLLRVGPGGITRKNNRAVFDAQGAGMGGPITRRVLAQRAGPAPSTAGAPVAGSAMARFLATLAGAGRASAFLASSTLPGVRGARETIYDARFDGQVGQVARLGEAAPGGGRFARFVSVAKPNGTGYGALVSALLGVSPADGVTPKNRAALFGRDSAGDMQRLLRTGDMLESAGPGSPLKTVRSFVALQAAAGSIGAARGYDDDGRVNVLVTFADRTQAVVRIQVP